MPYASVEQFLEYLDQFAAIETYDDRMPLIQNVLDRATAIIDLDLGVTSSLTAATIGTRTIYGDGGLYLASDTPMASVTAITAPSGYTVPTYIESDGRLQIVTSTGLLVYAWTPGLSYTDAVSNWTGQVWQRGVPYSVTATFGYNTTIMKALEEACLQIAVRLFRYRESGGSEVLGEGEALIQVRVQMSPLIKGVMEAIRRERSGDSVGVW